MAAAFVVSMVRENILAGGGTAGGGTMHLTGTIAGLVVSCVLAGTGGHAISRLHWGTNCRGPFGSVFRHWNQSFSTRGTPPPRASDGEISILEAELSTEACIARGAETVFGHNSLPMLFLALPTWYKR